MDRDDAILKLIAVFRKGREIDETKLLDYLRRFEKIANARKPGIERTFDENESRHAPAEMRELDAMTKKELEVLGECIKNFETYVSKQITRHMN